VSHLRKFEVNRVNIGFLFVFDYLLLFVRTQSDPIFQKTLISTDFA